MRSVDGEGRRRRRRRVRVFHRILALVVKAGPGVRIAVKGCKVANAGWEWRALSADELKAAPEAIAIRGYTLQKNAGGALEIDVTEPGDYELTGSGELTKLAGTKEEL